jgi:N-acetylglutamate synthase-like GNAT family acetyltransferase
MYALLGIVLLLQTVNIIFIRDLGLGLLFVLVLALCILRFRSAIQANNDMQKWVVYFNKVNVGVAKISRMKNYVSLNKLEVDANHQRRGLGTELLKCVISETAQPIYLVCAPDLEIFYRRLGFTTIANRKLPFLMRSLGKSSRIAMRYPATYE